MDIPGVGTMLGAAGASPEISFAGKTWIIGHPTQQAKAILEELVVSHAVAEVRSLKGVLPADAYVETFRELTQSIGAGDYRTWASGWQRIALGGGNAHLFLLSLLLLNHPKATEADALALALGEPEQVGAALARVVPGFFAILLAGLPLPAEKRAEMLTLLAAVVEKLMPPESPPSPPPPSTDRGTPAPLTPPPPPETPTTPTSAG